jgi:integrase
VTAAKAKLIFPRGGDETFSDNAMLAVLDRLGYGHVTVHGFRATFGTWAEDCTDYPDGVREAALAHKYKNETVAAYQRGAKFEKRRALMSDWAEFCTSRLSRETSADVALPTKNHALVA